MDALHNLTNLLHMVMLDVMPAAELARNGAHGWRGFEIRSYKNLACGHYYCQFNSRKPSVLMMEEFYSYGGFHYPWRVDIDLLKTDFFERPLSGQRELLVNFYQDALDQALEWQTSPERLAKVPEKLWAGRHFQNKAHLAYPITAERVSADYMTALALQDRLLELLKEVIAQQTIALAMSRPYLQYNSSGWKYRGLWMKLYKNEADAGIPEGPFPLHFKLDLFDHPAVLRCTGTKKELHLDLAKLNYFDLDKASQESLLAEFVQPALVYLKGRWKEHTFTNH